MRYPRLRRLFLLLLIVIPASGVFARQFMQADRCSVDAADTITGTLFVFCQHLVIDGTVDGNLIGAATNTIINGTVRDGIYLIGGQVDAYGTLSDDLHYLGAVLNIHENAKFEDNHADIFSLTMSTELDPNTRLPGSVIAAGYQLLLGGAVGGEVNFWGSALSISGEVRQDVTADVGDSRDVDGTAQLETLFLPFPVELQLINPGFVLAEGGSVGGNLRYRAPTRGSEMGSVEGAIIFNEIVSQPQIDISDEESLRQGVRQYLGAALREVATLGVVGLLALAFAPAITQAPLRNLRRRPLTSLGVGTLTFLLSFPVVVIVLVISGMLAFVLSLLGAGNLTIVALVVLLLLDIGGASLFYFVAIFLARSIVCLAIGKRLVRTVFEDDNSPRFLYVSLMAGAVVVSAFVSLPMIGWLLNALVLFLGLGAIVNIVQAQLRTIRESSAYSTNGISEGSGSRFGSRWLENDLEIDLPPLPNEIPTPPPPPAPPPKPRPRHTVGTDNLPDDFVWWDQWEKNNHE